MWHRPKLRIAKHAIAHQIALVECPLFLTSAAAENTIAINISELGSGTISGAERNQRGSFLELSWGGQEPFGQDVWPGGRTFLEDGDVVVLRYSAPGTGGGRITLGEVAGRIEPARA